MTVQPGEKFGNYEVLSKPDGTPDVLGSGSGGTTLKVRHVHLDTIAAVKILRRRAQASSREGQGFLSEARSAASLTHPHIARILDFGENAGQLYYVMDLCEGGSLEDFRNGHGVPSGEIALTWLYQAASAMAHAHAQNILHRDVKPSNLLIAREGEMASLKLIDFGLAGKTDPDAVTPNNDPVIGTPLFAAPEQLRGQAEKASDVFSLGASFLWLLTGSHLDTGDLPQVIDRRLSAQSYNALLATLPPPWHDVLAAFLAVDPAQRVTDGSAAVARIEQSFPDAFPLQPVPWSMVASDGPPAEPPVPENPADAWENDSATDWRTAWTPVDAPIADGPRRLFKATSPHAEGNWDVQLFESPDPATAELLVSQGHLLKRHAAPLGLGTVLLRRGENWFTLAWPALTGADALDWLRSGGVPPAAELLPRIRPLAAGLDGAARAGLDAFELHPALLHLVDPTETTAPGFAISVPMPLTTTEKGPAETGSTISGSINSPLPIRFAACLYHLLGGRPTPPAAFLNHRAYPAVPRLSERSNRYLGRVISGEHPAASCAEIVDRLAMEERLPGVTNMPSDSVGRTMFGTSASLTSTATLRQIPAPSQSLPGTPQVPASPSAAASVTSLPTVPPAPAPAVIPAIPPPAPAIPPVPQKASPAAVPAPPSSSNKSLKTVILVIVLLGAGVLIVGGGAAWYFLKPKPSPTVTSNPTPKAADPTPTPTPKADPAPDPKKTPTPTPTPDPTPPKTTAKENSSKLVKVPGDAATLAEAVALCSPGGSIEITGGTYKEPLVITKPLTLESKGATLEGSASSNNLVAIKGAIQVAINGLVIKESSREASGNPENVPALVLVADGATATLGNCTINGGAGTGILLLNKSTITLTGGQILNNRWTGLRVTAGSKATLESTSVRDNNIGVIVSNPGSTATFTAGSIVTDSSHNGIEITEAGAAKLSGCEVSTNHGHGIVVSGAGSSLAASAKSTMINNKLNGVEATNDATIDLTDCQMEGNELGFHSEKAGAITIVKSSFQNTVAGIFVDGGTGAVKVDNCSFSKHSDSGATFMGTRADLTNSTFSDNEAAAVFIQGASGSAKSNHITPASNIPSSSTNRPRIM